MVHVRQVLQALQDNRLIINGEKCVWGVPELDYLGHQISAAGVLPLPSHVAAIQEFPRPSTIKELQSFLGMVNLGGSFWEWHAPSAPLTDELCGSKKGLKNMAWHAAKDEQLLLQSSPVGSHLPGASCGGSIPQPGS
jgi:hypothetical protein